MRNKIMRDEPLAAFGVFAGGSQTNGAFFVMQVSEFGADGVIGTAPAIAARIAALGHKIRNYPMETQAVIETLINQGYKISHRARRFFYIKLKNNIAQVGLQT